MKTLDYPPLGAHALHLMRRVLDSLQNPGACSVLSTFHNHSTNLQRTLSSWTEFPKTPMSRMACWKGWRNAPKFRFAWFKISDDNIPWAIKTWRQPGPANDASLPMMGGGRDHKMCKYLQSLRVSQLCPSLVALTRFLLGKGWPRTSKSELMGSCWFTVKILLSLIHDISDNRGYHSGIFAILSIFPLLAGDQREKICMCNNFTLQYEYFTSNIRFDRGWVWCW